MKIKTSELSGGALDYAVALAEGYTLHDDYGIPKLSPPGGSGVMLDVLGRPGFYPMRRYSTDWSQGGPIIERERIQWCALNGQIEAWSGFDYIEWRSNWENDTCMVNGEGFGTDHKSILIAAMRCFVSSKLGDDVDVPEELV